MSFLADLLFKKKRRKHWYECPYCGGELRKPRSLGREKFCKKCGRKINIGNLKRLGSEDKKKFELRRELKRGGVQAHFDKFGKVKKEV